MGPLMPFITYFSLEVFPLKYAHHIFHLLRILVHIGQKPLLRYDDFDYKMHQGLAHIEISDAKVLKFPSKSDPTKRGTNTLRVENGMIHSFTRLN